MLEGDALEWYQQAARTLTHPAFPTAQRQPKVARLQSPRQRRAESQTINQTRAIYQPESKWNQTPEAPEGVELTRNVGPSDLDRNAPGWGAKATNSETEPGRRDRTKPQRTRGTTRRTAADWQTLADKYGI